jgi:RNA polymerase sigma-70 factor (ECF subfamily)
MSLRERLRAARPDLSATDPSLEERLREAYERAARPDVVLGAEAFVDHVAARLPDGDVAAGLGTLHLEDLYLAAACAAGIPGALDAFDRTFGTEILRAVRRAGSAALSPDDVGQMLREKLFVAPAKIASFNGRGPLRVWLRVALTRMVQNLAIRGPKEAPALGSALADVAAPTGDPELDAMRAAYRAEFRAAFAAAVEALEIRDRVLLQQRFALQRTQEELAEEYGVHVNTVARWLSRIRATVEERTRAELRRRLRLGAGEFTSILRLVASQLDLTLGKIE